MDWKHPTVNAMMDGSDAPPAVILHDEPSEIYHRVSAFNSGAIGKLRRSPAHFLAYRTQQGEDTAAMALGRAVHMLVLEPARSEQVVCMPDLGRSKADMQLREAFVADHQGCIILSADALERAQAMADAVRAHPMATQLLTGGSAEVSIYWRDGVLGVPCKARLDYLRPDRGVVDLKTTTDASPEAFRRSAATYLYHGQAAHYWTAVEAACDTSPAFFAWVVVENAAPYGVACYVIGIASLLAGRRIVSEAIEVYAQCLRSGTYPGYPLEITTLELPRWALRFDEGV